MVTALGRGDAALPGVLPGGLSKGTRLDAIRCLMWQDAIMVTAGGAETLPFLASCGVLPASLAFFVLYGRVLDLHLQRSWVREPPSGSKKLCPLRLALAQSRRLGLNPVSQMGPAPRHGQ